MSLLLHGGDIAPHFRKLTVRLSPLRDYSFHLRLFVTRFYICFRRGQRWARDDNRFKRSKEKVAADGSSASTTCRGPPPTSSFLLGTILPSQVKGRRLKSLVASYSRICQAAFTTEVEILKPVPLCSLKIGHWGWGGDTLFVSIKLSSYLSIIINAIPSVHRVDQAHTAPEITHIHPQLMTRVLGGKHGLPHLHNLLTFSLFTSKYRNSEIPESRD